MQLTLLMVRILTDTDDDDVAEEGESDVEP